MKKQMLAALTAILLVSCGSETTETPSSVSAQTASIEETVILDQNGLKITATGLDDSFMGDELKLLVENNSGQNLTVQSHASSVNGYMITNIMSIDVANGKKVNDALTLTASEMEDCGITSITDLAFTLHVFNTDTWEAVIDTPVIELKTNLSGTVTQTYDDSGNVVYDAGGIRIITKGKTDDSILGPGIQVYVENNTSESIMVQTRNVSINGFMVDSYYSPEILPGKRSLSSLTISDTSLTENGITDFTSAELSFVIINPSTFMDIAETGPVNLTL